MKNAFPMTKMGKKIVFFDEILDRNLPEDEERSKVRVDYRKVRINWTSVGGKNVKVRVNNI